MKEVRIEHRVFVAAALTAAMFGSLAASPGNAPFAPPLAHAHTCSAGYTHGVLSWVTNACVLGS